jgi:pimeloyl-ACP methyl ester carboxylesterase
LVLCRTPKSLQMPHKITFRDKGQGPLLLLLHGYGGTPQHWEAIADRLCSDFRVISLNLSHIYMSTDKLLFSTQIQCLVRFIEENFQKEKVHVAGLSFGGALAWGLACRRPDLVEKLILVNPLVTFPVQHFLPKELRFFFSLPMNLTSIYLMLRTPMGQGFLKRSAEIFRDERSQGAIAMEKLRGRKLMFVAHLIHHFSWILRSEDWSVWEQKLRQYQGESLLIFDKNDLLFSQESYQKFAQQMGCNQVHFLEGAGHLAIKNRPEEIASMTRDFIHSARYFAQKRSS